MKTIKIIDLLNKIANGEEAPKKIKTDINTIWIYDENNQRYHLQDAPFITLSFEATNNLNNEVEIIEELEQDIDIQAIEELDNWFVDKSEGYREFDIQAINLCFRKHQEKINELIRAVKQLDNKAKEKNEQ